MDKAKSPAASTKTATRKEEDKAMLELANFLYGQFNKQKQGLSKP
jgi:hypothetical protein